MKALSQREQLSLSALLVWYELQYTMLLGKEETVDILNNCNVGISRQIGLHHHCFYASTSLKQFSTID